MVSRRRRSVAYQRRSLWRLLVRKLFPQAVRAALEARINERRIFLLNAEMAGKLR